MYVHFVLKIIWSFGINGHFKASIQLLPSSCLPAVGVGDAKRHPQSRLTWASPCSPPAPSEHGCQCWAREPLLYRLHVLQSLAAFRSLCFWFAAVLVLQPQVWPLSPTLSSLLVFSELGFVVRCLPLIVEHFGYHFFKCHSYLVSSLTKMEETIIKLVK